MDHRLASSAYGASTGALELSLNDILSFIKPSEEDRAKRVIVIDEFKAVVRSVESLRGATVEPFGSYVSNLFTRWGDLDISIELPGFIISSAGKNRKKNFLRDIMRALQRTGGGRNFQFIPTARVPLLIFESNHQRISCDISIDNLVGQIKSKFLFWITEIDERFRDLVLLIKEWAKAQNINDPKNGTLNSYSLTLLVIFHFQTCTPAILPPLKDIYGGNIVDDLTGVRSLTERRIQDTCAANIERFKSQRFWKLNRSSLPELLISFFEKFSGIKYQSADYAICTYTGQWEYIWHNRGWMEKPHKILIEDPFEQPDNASRAVGASQLETISTAFEETYRKLSSSTVLSNRSSLMAILVSPQIRLLLGMRIPRGNSGASSEGHGHHYTVNSPIEEQFQHAMRLESRPSSSTVSLRRPGGVHMEGRQLWRRTGRDFLDR